MFLAFAFLILSLVHYVSGDKDKALYLILLAIFWSRYDGKSDTRDK